MRIWDTFMLRNELDMLELRLEEISDKCYKHILVESKTDFHGRPKPLYYAENYDRFEKWNDKIIHVVASGLNGSPWQREHQQRDFARTQILDRMAEPDDIILICDVDEIPSAKALNWRGSAAIALKMKTCHSAVDWVYPRPEYASVMVRWSFIRGYQLGEVRDNRASYEAIEENAGWHLSWLGGVDAQRDKLTVTYHLELPQQEKDYINDGTGYEKGTHVGIQMIPVNVDKTWPRYIWQHRCPESWFRPREAANVPSNG